MRKTIPLLLLACAAVPGNAEELLVAETTIVYPPVRHPAYFHTLDTATDTLTSSVVVGDRGFLDVAIGPHDGLVHAGASNQVSRLRIDGTVVDEVWKDIDDARDLAWDSAGNLVVLDAWSAARPESGLYEVALEGTVRALDASPGLSLMGMDVPRSGPAEDGIVVIGFDFADGGRYYGYVYRRQGDRTLQREGPFGPLALVPAEQCPRSIDRMSWHLAVRQTGTSYLVADTCTNNVEEFDLDGNHVRTFAHVDQDPTIPPNPANILDDPIQNFLVTRDDHVYVATMRRLYHFDPDGALVRKIDHLFNWAAALAELDPPPFTSQLECNPFGVGFWKRQCRTDAPPPRRSRTSSPRAPDVGGPSLHPFFRDGRLPGVLARVDARLAEFGVTACEALWPDEQRELRARALMHFAAALCNVEDGDLDLDCPRTVDDTPRDVRTLITDIEALLRAGDEDSLQEAKRLAEILNAPPVVP